MANRFWGWTAMLTIKVVEFGALYAWQALGSETAGRALTFWLWTLTALCWLTAFFEPRPMSTRDDQRRLAHTWLSVMLVLSLAAADHAWLATAHLLGVVLQLGYRAKCIDVTPTAEGDHA
jgi:hypothetical protein